MSQSPLRLNKHLVSLTAPSTPAAEQYLSLRMKMEALRRARNVRVIGVTSPGAGDGKTVTSINLAAALSRDSDARVLLIDADLRRSAVPRYLGIKEPASLGLADAIANPEITLKELVQHLEPLPFGLVSVGAADISAQRILGSDRLGQLLDEARQQFDFVILDTAPLVPVFDTCLLAASLDGLIVVVAADKTPRKLLEEALNLLDPEKVLGIVFNGDTKPLAGRYSYYRQHASDRA